MAFSHRFDPTVLREYDIRGIVGRTLHPADAFAIGRAFGTIVARAGGRTVAVGYDGRLSSPELEAAAGARARGERDGGGAHRPRPDADAVLRRHHAADRRRGDGDRQPQPARLQRLQDDAAAASRSSATRSPSSAAWPPRATWWRKRRAANATVDVSADYVARLLQDWDGGDRPLKVVWDNGNGAAGDVLQSWSRRCRASTSCCSAKSTAASRTITPTRRCRRTLQQLIAEVRRARCRHRHRVRRRRRPHRRGRRHRRDHVRRPVDGAAGARRAEDASGRHDHRRRQGQPGAVRRDRARRAACR